MITGTVKQSNSQALWGSPLFTGGERCVIQCGPTDALLGRSDSEDSPCPRECRRGNRTPFALIPISSTIRSSLWGRGHRCPERKQAGRTKHQAGRSKDNTSPGSHQCDVHFLFLQSSLGPGPRFWLRHRGAVRAHCLHPSPYT